MTAIDIDKKLRDKFKSHKYELSNSYVYNWESDFFSITSTGYSQEIEVKVSLSDFRADFMKTSKHNLLKSAFHGNKTYCWAGYLQYEVKGFHRKRWDEKVPFETTYSHSKKSDETVWRKRGWEFQQISSEIRIQEIGNCPNKFWYCCPTGVIPVNEVPEYAGLYYISDNMRMTVIKKAPFIHKEKQDLTQVLLDKFYWESINLRNAIKRKQLSLSY